jgi:hypothetical protein
MGQMKHRKMANVQDERRLYGNPSVKADFGRGSGGIEQQLVGITGLVLRQRIESALEGAEHIWGSFAKRV